MKKKKKQIAQAAIDAVNNAANAPELTYEETRDMLLGLQAHVAYLLTIYNLDLSGI